MLSKNYYFLLLFIGLQSISVLSFPESYFDQLVEKYKTGNLKDFRENKSK